MEKNVYVWAVAMFTEKKVINGEEKTLRWNKAIRLNNRSELISQIELFGADKIHLTGSKKEAEELADYWDGCAQRNGDFRWWYYK